MASPRTEHQGIGGMVPRFSWKTSLAVLVVLGLTGYSVAGTNFNIVELLRGTGAAERFVSEMFPPDLSGATLRATGTGILETFQMSFLGALLGAVVAFPLSALGTQEIATVGASRAEWTDEMRRIARKQHAAVTKIAHAPAGERVNACPLDFEFGLRTEHRTQAREDALRFPLLLRVGIEAQLKVDAPDVVRLPMQQGRLIRMKRRIEPEPALRRKIRRHVDVRDQEAVAKHLAFGVEPEHMANRASGAVRDDQPVACQRVFAILCRDA